MITDLLRVVLIQSYPELRPKVRTNIGNNIRIFLDIYLNF